MMSTMRRRPELRRRPGSPKHNAIDIPKSRGIRIPQEIRILVPINRTRRRWRQVILLLLAGGLLSYGIYRLLLREKPLEAEEEKPVEMREVEIETPPPPPPEPEPEPEPRASDEEPEMSDPLPSLSAEPNEGPVGPKVALDLALGTGGEGLAIAGTGGGQGGGGSGRFTFEAGKADRDPELTQPNNPAMPRQAQEAGKAGKFEAVFIVGADGRISDITVSGQPAGYGYEEAIKKALARRRYRPAESGGVPVSMRLRQSFEFSLE